MPGIDPLESAGSSNPSASAADSGQRTGVKSSTASLPLRSAANSDQNLVQRVSDALGKTGHPSLRELKVSIQKGVVILQGEVPNAYLKMLAMTTSLTVGGAWWVVNCLQVSIRPSR